MLRKPGPTARARAKRARQRLKAYKAAAKSVVGDDLSCRRCGTWSEDLQIHHIVPRSRAPELRTVAANLLPLCKSCHREIHAAGVRA